MKPEQLRSYVDKFCKNFAMEIELYTHILEITKKEHALIASGSVDTVLVHVAEKQKLMEKIEVIEQDQTELKKSWDEVRQSVAENDKKRIKEPLGVLSRLLEELISLERKNEKLLSEKIEMIKGQQQGKTPSKHNIAEAYKRNKEK